MASRRTYADGPEPDTEALLTILTTEHFTLQGAQAKTVSESSARAAPLVPTPPS